MQSNAIIYLFKIYLIMFPIWTVLCSSRCHRCLDVFPLLLNCGISLSATQTGFRCVWITFTSSLRLTEYADVWKGWHWQRKANLKKNILVSKSSLTTTDFFFSSWEPDFQLGLQNYGEISVSLIFPEVTVNYSNHSRIFQLLLSIYVLFLFNRTTLH